MNLETHLMLQKLQLYPRESWVGRVAWQGKTRQLHQTEGGLTTEPFSKIWNSNFKKWL